MQKLAELPWYGAEAFEIILRTGYPFTSHGWRVTKVDIMPLRKVQPIIVHIVQWLIRQTKVRHLYKRTTTWTRWRGYFCLLISWLKRGIFPLCRYDPHNDTRTSRLIKSDLGLINSDWSRKSLVWRCFLQLAGFLLFGKIALYTSRRPNLSLKTFFSYRTKLQVLRVSKLLLLLLFKPYNMIFLLI